MFTISGLQRNSDSRPDSFYKNGKYGLQKKKHQPKLAEPGPEARSPHSFDHIGKPQLNTFSIAMVNFNCQYYWIEKHLQD